MVAQIRDFGIQDKRILNAMNRIPRHLFIPAAYRGRCNPYGNHPCYIGYGQTISQPYVVAYMTEKLRLKKDEKVLEIGTGSGYQAALLAELNCRVYSVERIEALARHSAAILKMQGYTNIKTAFKDGFEGWQVHAPFDAIIVTCAPDQIPPKLVKQLKDGGRMIVPVGANTQRLVLLRKRKGKVKVEADQYVRFVPMKKKRERSGL